jgi:hypothetical protein
LLFIAATHIQQAIRRDSAQFEPDYFQLSRLSDEQQLTCRLSLGRIKRRRRRGALPAPDRRGDYRAAKRGRFGL